MDKNKINTHCENCIFHKCFFIKNVSVSYCGKEPIFKPLSADVTNCCYFEKNKVSAKKPYKD